MLVLVLVLEAEAVAVAAVLRYDVAAVYPFPLSLPLPLLPHLRHTIALVLIVVTASHAVFLRLTPSPLSSPLG